MQSWGGVATLRGMHHSWAAVTATQPGGLKMAELLSPCSLEPEVCHRGVSGVGPLWGLQGRICLRLSRGLWQLQANPGVPGCADHPPASAPAFHGALPGCMSKPHLLTGPLQSHPAPGWPCLSWIPKTVTCTGLGLGPPQIFVGDTSQSLIGDPEYPRHPRPPGHRRPHWHLLPWPARCPCSLRVTPADRGTDT